MKFNKFLIILFISITSILTIPKVYAECSKEELQKYKELANNIKINYKYLDNYTDYNSNKIENMFSLSITNLAKEIVIVTDPIYMFENNTNESYINLEDGIIDGGKNVRISYYTSDYSTCPNTILKKDTLKIPVFNKYWTDELCKGIENYLYCNKFISNEITYEGFKKHVLEYKDSLLKSEEIVEEEIKDTNKIENFIKNNLNIIIICSTSLVFVIAIIILIKKFGGKKL